MHIVHHRLILDMGRLLVRKPTHQHSTIRYLTWQNSLTVAPQSMNFTWFPAEKEFNLYDSRVDVMDCIITKFAAHL